MTSPRLPEPWTFKHPQIGPTATSISRLNSTHEFRILSEPRCTHSQFSPKTMKRPTLVNGQEVLEMVSKHPLGIRLGRLHELAAERFGPGASFHTGSQAGLDIDELILHFETRGHIGISSGLVTASSQVAKAS
jgi:probable metal-binding protein